MENNELKNTWEKIDAAIELKSRNELQTILETKTRRVIGRFYISYVLTVLVTAGFFAFLIISTIDRWDDVYYRINNLTIGLISSIALVSEIAAVRLFQKDQYTRTLKEQIEKSISYMNRELKQRISYYILPLIAIPSILSINVYYSHDSFLDILKDEESIYGLIFGFIGGIIVGYIFLYRYRKYQTKNLNYLKELYDRLCNGS